MKFKAKAPNVGHNSSRSIAVRKQTTIVDGDNDDDGSGEIIPSTSLKARKQKTPSKTTAIKTAKQDKTEVELEIQSLCKPTSSKTADETYQKLSLNQHILKRPDTYVGSVVKTQSDMWVLDKTTKEVQRRKITYVPGLYKIFDEILVNAADNKQADDKENTMTYIKVGIDRDKGEISVENNGKGIPTLMHGVSANRNSYELLLIRL